MVSSTTTTIRILLILFSRQLCFLRVSSDTFFHSIFCLSEKFEETAENFVYLLPLLYPKRLLSRLFHNDDVETNVSTTERFG